MGKKNEFQTGSEVSQLKTGEDAKHEKTLPLFSDNRAIAVTQCKLINQMNFFTASNPNVIQRVRLDNYCSPAQRKILYKSGPYFSKEALTVALLSRFNVPTTIIDPLIKRYEDDTQYNYGGRQVFDEIAQELVAKGYPDSTVVVNEFRDEAHHGPMLPHGTLPWQPDREKENKTIKQVLSTMNTGSATLANFTLIGTSKKLSMHSKQKGSSKHAEEVLLPNISNYIEKIGENEAVLTLNITINNFFCERCLPQILKFKKDHTEMRFHVYFKNGYGTSDRMKEAIGCLQSAGILVSQFEIIPGQHSFVAPGLDEHSESETEEKSDISSKITQAELRATKSTVSFEEWMSIFNKLSLQEYGEEYDEFPDRPYRVRYDLGASVRNCYLEYFANGKAY